MDSKQTPNAYQELNDSQQPANSLEQSLDISQQPSHLIEKSENTPKALPNATQQSSDVVVQPPNTSHQIAQVSPHLPNALQQLPSLLEQLPQLLQQLPNAPPQSLPMLLQLLPSLLQQLPGIILQIPNAQQLFPTFFQQLPMIFQQLPNLSQQLTASGMQDDANKFLALLRTGFHPMPPNIATTFNSVRTCSDDNKQQAAPTPNPMSFLSSLQLLSSMANQNLFSNQLAQQNGQSTSNASQPSTSKAEVPAPAPAPAPVKMNADFTQMNPSLTALCLNIDQPLQHAQDVQTNPPPLSSTTSIDEGVVTSSNSPIEVVAEEPSPAQQDEALLPKESEYTTLKRPATIQEMLLKNKKRARLDDLMNGLMNGLIKKKVSGMQLRFNNKIKKLKMKDGSEEEQHTFDFSDCPTNWLFSHFGLNPDEPMTKAPRPMSKQQSTIFEAPGDCPTDLIPANWKTINNEVYESPDACYIPHDQVFALVPGRLSLLSNVVKYKMTVGEVRRRLLGPEAFNFSLLGALLRRAKMPEKSKALVTELRAIGLIIPRGRRRAERVTLMSALTEQEAAQMATDFATVSDQHFPVNDFATLAVEFATDKNLLDKRLVELHFSRKMIDEFHQWLKMDRSEVRDLCPALVLPPRLQEPLTTYSNLTHGFGVAGLMVGLLTFRKYVNLQIEMIESQSEDPCS